MAIFIKRISNLTKIGDLWNKLYKPRVIWDLWVVRKVFVDIAKYPVLSVVAMKNNEVIGMLPLWYNPKEKQYEWISGWWAENSRPFVEGIKARDIMNLMLKSIKGKVVLDCMEEKYAKLFTNNVEPDFNHYGLNLRGVDWDWEKYLMRLKKKKRQNIRRDIRSVLSLKPEFRYDDIKDLKHLVRLNKIQMKRKIKMYNDETLSVFETDKLQEKYFYELWKRSGKDYKSRIIAVIIGKKVVACDFCLIYKKRYYSLLGGADVSKVSGLGNFMNYVDIQDAINHKCLYIDFLMEDHHWKDEWFKADKRYKYTRK